MGDKLHQPDGLSRLEFEKDDFIPRDFDKEA